MRFVKIFAGFTTAIAAQNNTTVNYTAPESYWWWNCTFGQIDTSKMARLPELQAKITDKDSCLAVKSRMFNMVDFDQNFVVEQCEIAYGCLAVNQTADPFECMRYANEMPTMTMSNLWQMCEEDWPERPKNALQESTFLTTDEATQIASLLPANSTLAPAYIAQQDGWTISDFHSKVDGRGPTLTVIKVAESGYVFGGYTDISWESGGSERKDGNSFVFFFKDGVVKKVTHKNMYEIYQDRASLVVFSSAFKVDGNCNTNMDSYTYFDGDNYNLPQGTSDSYSAANAVIGLGSSIFYKCANMETYLVE